MANLSVSKLTIENHPRAPILMHLLRTLNIDHMVLEYLRAEVSSPRYKADILHYVSELGISRELIDRPDLSNTDHNQLRAQILGKIRGYPNKLYFENLPTQTAWYEVILEQKDLELLYYAAIKDSEWLTLSNQSLRVLDCVAALEQGISFKWNTHIQEVRKCISQEQEMPLPIVVGSSKFARLVIVEGHTRISALVLEGKREIKVLASFSDEMSNWDYFGVR